VNAGPAGPDPEAAPLLPPDDAPAGFWRRYLAWSLDWALLSPLLLVIVLPSLRVAFAALQRLLAQVQDWLLEKLLAGDLAGSPLALADALLADLGQRQRLEAEIAGLGAQLLQAGLLAAALAALYFIGFEASRWQATPGKRLLGLRVQASAGGPLGLARTALRFFAGALSWLSLNLGHALAGWRADGRALHDLIAGAQVRARGPMPPWARALLWLQAGLLAAAMLALFARLAWVLGQLATL
jgi:uncharacterized RDD family membrane protein YckC